MSKVAFISDIHGNIEALDAVLDDLTIKGVDRIICLGDIASYNADQDRCMERIHESHIDWIAGNHDLMAAGILSPLSCSESAFYSATKSRKSLKPKWRDIIQSLPLMITNDLFCAFHATPENITEYLTREKRLFRTIEIIKTQKLPNIAFFGHTHQSLVTTLQDGRLVKFTEDYITLDAEAISLVNVGTVGEQRGEDKSANYTIFDTGTLEIFNHKVPYNHAISLRKSIDNKFRLDQNSKISVIINKFRQKFLFIRHRFFPRNIDDPSLPGIIKRSSNEVSRSII
ncbi:MAG: metallophosphatase family protein [Candidatus Thiodiazotropha sp. (ex Monitilora ramsayi)]|nr:metallophosphatase family protein [Candidatus Thiodiazotropha sp. (ex Monitilora ramsayi)]